MYIADSFWQKKHDLFAMQFLQRSRLFVEDKFIRFCRGEYVCPLVTMLNTTK